MDNDTRPTARLRPFRTPVRGHAFSAVPPGAFSAAPPGEQAPEPGLTAQLAREPDNPADPWAVAVWAGHDGERLWRVGYLDRGVAARVAPRLDAGATIGARLDGWVEEPDGRWRRPVLLVLPEHRLPEDRATPGGDAVLWGRPPGVRRRRISSRAR